MPSINVEENFPDHRKTMQLEDELRREPETWLVRLWCYTCRHHPETGRLSGFSADAIEKVVRWRYGAGRLVAAMVKVGFLEPIPVSEGGGFAVHDWLHWARHLAIYSERGRKGAKARWSKKAREPSEDAQVMLKHSLSNSFAVPCSESELKTDNDSVLNSAKTPEELGGLWCFIAMSARALGSDERDGGAALYLGEMHRQGLSIEAMRLEILSKDRKRTEKLWDFEKRMLPKKGGKAKVSLFTGLDKFSGRAK